MGDMKMDPKLESIRSSTVEFISHEKQSFTEFGEKVMQDVENLINDSVTGASTKIGGLMKRVEDVIRTEPLVAIAAFAITGLALANLMRQRMGRKSKAKEEDLAAPQSFH